MPASPWSAQLCPAGSSHEPSTRAHAAPLRAPPLKVSAAGGSLRLTFELIPRPALLATQSSSFLCSHVHVHRILTPLAQGLSSSWRWTTLVGHRCHSLTDCNDANRLEATKVACRALASERRTDDLALISSPSGPIPGVIPCPIPRIIDVGLIGLTLDRQKNFCWQKCRVNARPLSPRGRGSHIFASRLDGEGEGTLSRLGSQEGAAVARRRKPLSLLKFSLGSELPKRTGVAGPPLDA